MLKSKILETEKKIKESFIKEQKKALNLEKKSVTLNIKKNFEKKEKKGILNKKKVYFKKNNIKIFSF